MTYLFTCNWCGKSAKYTDYCSERCRTASMRYAVKSLEALQNDDVDAPSKEDIDRAMQRAPRWDPESMADRVSELEAMIA